MNTPTIGPLVPRRGNAFTRWLGRTVLKLGGWRFEGTVPDVPKFICIGAPHTSNWDFIVVLASVMALGIRMSIMVKHTATKGPLGPLMLWSGALPVDRRAAHGVVGECVQAFRTHEKLTMAIAPEGSRTPGAQWKTGFWHIARQAGVPILPCAMDYGRRVVRFGEVLHATDSLEADFAKISAFYMGTKGAKRTLKQPILPRGGSVSRAAE